MRKYKIALDFGGTKIKLGIVSDGEIIAQEQVDVIDRSCFMVHTQCLKIAVEKMLNELSINLYDCTELGVAVPCLVSSDQKKVTQVFQKYDDLLYLDVQKWGQHSFGLHTKLENDARAALVGEWLYGAGEQIDNLFMMTLGTGCGTAAIIDGKPFRGTTGIASNLGGQSITHRDGEKCFRGNRGCMEAQVATWALQGIACKDEKYVSSTLAQVSTLDYFEVFNHAEAGDALAIKLRDRAIDTWSAALVNAIHFLDPDKIVIGGGIMGSADYIIPRLQHIVDRDSIQVREPIQIVPAKLGNGAALLGVHEHL